MRSTTSFPVSPHLGAALALITTLSTACIAELGEPAPDPAASGEASTEEALRAGLGRADVHPATAGVADLAERRLMNPTGWYWLTGATAAQLADKVDDGYRIFDIEVENTDPYRFSAALVANQGVHQQTWWWYYGKTAAEIQSLITANQARIIDLEIDFVGGIKRYAAVMVSNTGSEAKSWWYYSQLTFDQVGDKVTENDARLIDLDSYVYGGVRYYDAVMIPNQGTDAMSWWYYSGLTASQVSDKLIEHRARLTDIEVREVASDGPRFVAIMERSEGQAWWWYHGKTMSEVNDLAAQNGARIIDVEPYDTAAGKRLAVIMLRNTNDLTERMRLYLEDGRTGGAYGLRLKRIGGATLASLQADRPFYPASTVKTMVHAHAMRMVDGGMDLFSTQTTKYTNGAESCSDNHAGHTSGVVESLDVALRKMMEQSDNQSTNALQELLGSGSAVWGRAFINATAHGVLDMSSDSQLAHKLGCGGPSNNPANSLTLLDLGSLYEHVATDLFTDPTNRDRFYERMLNGRGDIDTVIDEEAVALGLSGAVVSSFKSNTRTAAKAGSYTTGAGVDYLSIGGWVSLPTLRGAREYTFGLFIDEADSITADFSIWTARAELLRDEIRSALSSYL
jgi:hypothetical protein